ncbi:hypothetical protein PVK06_040843 [Gossypium arboreum]|uniref:MULE transposase domain-containing protein n=1 Tax=Gossypium arboreum TaxID=29729 RepID=A0ABR0N6J8_GOSAR|nr:hypothetical protein PVK06_040843 [Gossypium arboreum]
MSKFYGSNLNEGNEISMATSPFFTDQVFESREELMQWVQNMAFSLGYIIVTRRSKAKENGVVSYVTLICDRGGEYKFKESSKKSGTKKTNCKFRSVDETYKTNKYDLPFVQIVGVTSTNKTFSIAFAFIINEKEENYNWALTCLRLTLEECMYPRVIVTDRELALMMHANKFSLMPLGYYADGTLLKILKSIIAKSQLTSIYESFEKSRIVLKHRHNLPYFRLLWGFVALEVLDILEGEFQRSSRHQLDSSNCGCKLRHSYGLPCTCMLSVYLNSGDSEQYLFVVVMAKISGSMFDINC